MLLSSGAQVGVLIASTLTSVAIARLLGPGGTGRFTLALNVLTMLTLLFSIGLRQGLIYLVSTGEWRPRAAFRESQAAGFALGVVGGVVGLAIYELTSGSVLSGISFTMAAAAAIALPFAISLTFSAGMVLAQERWEAFSGFQLLGPALIFVFAVALAPGFGSTGAIAGLALGNIVAGVIGAWWVHAKTGGAVPAARTAAPEPSDRSPLRRAVGFGAQTWVANLLQLFNYRIDIFILNAFAATADVGVYSVAVTVTAIGWLLPNAIQSVLFSRVADLSATAKRDESARGAADDTVARGVRHTVILMLPIAALLSFLLLVVVPLLYGPRFHHAVVLGFLLLPGVVVLSVGKVFLTVATARGYPGYFTIVSLISAPLTVGVYLLLIPSLDADGAAIASTLSYVGTTILGAIAYRRATGIGLRESLVPRRRDVDDYRDAIRALNRRLARSRA